MPTTKPIPLSEQIAEHWFYSCDAPDTEETAKEIHRLANMIDDVLAGKRLEWKVKKHYLGDSQLK